jgi:beta-glucosidase
VVVVGDQSGIFNTATVGEAVDGTTCALPGVQRELVEAVVATGTPTVVVLTHGRPFVLDWMAEAVPAIVSAWFPGEEGGTAVASTLFGDTVPGGKVPVSFPGSVGSLPYPYNRTSMRAGSYYDGSAEPVFPFGHGLSYTSFEYGDLILSSTDVATDGAVRVSCRITNTGSRGGDEVVQLYLRDPVARTSRPRLELKGFKRVRLEAGESRTITFVLGADRTAIWDVREGWVVEPGSIEIKIGASSEDIRLAGEITLTGPVRQVGSGRALLTHVEVA